MNKRSSIGSIASMAVIAVAMPAQAQDNNNVLIEEIVVTAQKREQSAQDVGIAINAFSGNQIKALGLKDSTEIAMVTPGVHLSGSLGGQFVTFNIRGVAQSDYIDTAESPNAVYVDDAYVAFAAAQRFAMFDLERVEVLKGPQGTLFGRNATGGLVHYISKKPTEEAEGFLDVTYGSFNQVRVEAAAGGPISDSVRVRFSGYHNQHDPILENTMPGADDEWDDDSQAVRAQIEADLGEKSTLHVSAMSGRSVMSSSPYMSVPSYPVFNNLGQQTNSILNPGGTDPFGYADSDLDDLTVRKDTAELDASSYYLNSATAKYIWSGDDITFTSITDYRDAEKHNKLDNDAGPFVTIDFFADATYDQFSQEFRVSGNNESLNWQTGLYYLDYNIDASSGLESPIATSVGMNLMGPPLAGARFNNVMNLQTQSYSAFAQADYSLSEDLTLVAGARLIKEEKEYSHRVDMLDADTHAPIVLGLIPTFEDETSDTLWSGKLQLEWTPSDDTLVYLGVNRGVKAGSFNQDLGGFSGGIGGDNLIPASYDEEVLYAYELGFKTTTMDKRLRINGSAYYYDYKGFQAFRYEQLTTYITNEDARTYGAELEVLASPVDDLEIMASAAYVNVRVKDATFQFGTRDVQPAYTPEFQASAVLRYGWDVGTDGARMTAQANVTYSSDFYNAMTNFDATEYPSYVLADLRLVYEANDQWSLEVFGKNIFDKRYKTVGFDISSVIGISQFAIGQPRWFGANVRYNF